MDARPVVIQALARTYPPNRLYRLTGTGQRVTVVSYAEDGTVTVAVTGRYNRVLFSHTVFGVNPTALTECGLPRPGEDLGDTAAEAGYDTRDIKDVLIPMLLGLSRGKS